jgi:hypothetical protein
MAFDAPQPGQVIWYSYLWWNESRRGRTEGGKDRPCGVVLTRLSESGSSMLVYVLPITHTAPADPEAGIEIPPATKRRLGMDAERSWIITTEINRFVWPGPDIRALPSGEYSYGYLPGKLLQLALDQVKTHARKNQLRTVNRDESGG